MANSLKINSVTHITQRQILHVLLYLSAASFAELQEHLDGISSDSLSYHLRQLLKIKIITKDQGIYKISDKGKEISSRIINEGREVIHYPKVSICPIIFNKDKSKMLLGKKLYNPLKNLTSFLTIKVRFATHYNTLIDESLVKELKVNNWDKQRKYLGGIRLTRYKEDSVLADVIFNYFEIILDEAEVQLDSSARFKYYWHDMSKPLLEMESTWIAADLFEIIRKGELPFYKEYTTIGESYF